MKTKPNWYSLTIIGIIAVVMMLSMLVGCSTTHKVIQSAYNTATGDSIIIRYEQTGNMKKF